eukprot:1131423-Pyramimonas_sp.AAC.1
MEEHSCPPLATQEWSEIHRPDREQLSAASARVQQGRSGAQIKAQAAQRGLAISEAEKQVIAQRVEREQTVA